MSASIIDRQTEIERRLVSASLVWAMKHEDMQKVSALLLAIRRDRFSHSLKYVSLHFYSLYVVLRKDKYITF